MGRRGWDSVEECRLVHGVVITPHVKVGIGSLKVLPQLLYLLLYASEDLAQPTDALERGAE